MDLFYPMPREREKGGQVWAALFVVYQSKTAVAFLMLIIIFFEICWFMKLYLHQETRYIFNAFVLYEDEIKSMLKIITLPFSKYL